MQKNIIYQLLYLSLQDIKKKHIKKVRIKMEMKGNYDIEKIKKEQVEKIKNSIKKVVNEDKEYYKNKEYAKYFLE